MKRDILLYIQDIIRSMEAIEQFVEGMDLDQFIHDDRTSSAVIRKFEIIGEASKYIPNDIRNQFPLIPWKDMAGMRDVLIHAYFGIDHQLVWDSVKKEIPGMKTLLKTMLADLAKSGNETS